MTKHFRTIFFALLLCIPARALFAEKIQILIPKEIKPNAFKLEKLHKNPSPLSLATLEQSAHRESFTYTIWLLREGNLWIWNPIQNTLNNFNLEPHTPPSHTTMGPSGHQAPSQPMIQYRRKIFFTYASYFYQHDPQKRRFFRLLFDQNKVGIALDLIPQDQYIWILTTKGFFKFDMLGNNIVDYKAYNLNSYKRHGFFLNSETFVYPVKNSIFVLNPHELSSNTNTNSSVRKIYNSKNTIIGIHKVSPESILLTTPTTIVRIDSTGKKIQTIPVARERKVAASFIDDNRHAFILDDGLVEIYEKLTKNVGRFIVPIQKNENIVKFELFGPYIIVRYSKNFQIFNMTESSEYRFD